MSVEELINKLKKETKNIDFAINYEDEVSIVIYYSQEHFSIYGKVEFDKNILKNVNRDKYLKMIARDIAHDIGKKCFLGDKENE